MFSLSCSDDWITDPFKSEIFLFTLFAHEDLRKKREDAWKKWESQPTTGENKRLNKPEAAKIIFKSFGKGKQNLFHKSGIKSQGRDILLVPPVLHNLAFINRTALDLVCVFFYSTHIILILKVLQVYPELDCMKRWRKQHENLKGNIALGKLVASFTTIRKIVCKILYKKISCQVNGLAVSFEQNLMFNKFGLRVQAPLFRCISILNGIYYGAPEMNTITRFRF